MKKILTLLFTAIVLTVNATVYTTNSVGLNHCAGDTISLKFYADGATYNHTVYHYTVCFSETGNLATGIKVGNYAPIYNGMMNKFSQTSPGTITIVLPSIADTFYIGVAISNASGTIISPCVPVMGQPIIIKDCTVGINESDNLHKINTYPNPASNELNVDLPVEEGIVRVFDFIGNLVMEKEANGSTMKLDVAYFRSGTYILNTGNYNTKFIILR